MIPFNYINEDLLKVLQEHKITEEDLFHYHGDLYVGCKSHTQATIIKNSGKWKAVSSIFVPQKGSEMEKYSHAVDVGFGAMSYDYCKKHNIDINDTKGNG